MADIKMFWADKREKSVIFQNASPFQKFYAPEMQKHPCNGRSKIALTQKRPQGFVQIGTYASFVYGSLDLHS